MSGRLYHGDNLSVLSRLSDGSVDLVYLDPPFATGRDFSMGESAVQNFGSGGEVAYSDDMEGEEYLSFIRDRLVLLRDVLSDNGSIYLHIDNEMGPYLKVMMDEIFGSENHVNTITRLKCNPKNFARNGYGNQTDKILFYTKTGNHIWNDPRQPYTDEQIERLYSKVDEDGRHFATSPLHAPSETDNGDTGKAWKGVEPPEGRHWRHSPEKLTELDENGDIYWSSNGNPRKKRYADSVDGPRRQDVWEFKDPQSVDYPTQKPLEMIEMIVKASSNEDSVVLDPFCGGGTTCLAAANQGREFIGIDESESAITVTSERLSEFELEVIKGDS